MASTTTLSPLRSSPLATTADRTSSVPSPSYASGSPSRIAALQQQQPGREKQAIRDRRAGPTASTAAGGAGRDPLSISPRRLHAGSEGKDAARGSAREHGRAAPGPLASLLPPGMDVRQALAKCEDPGLSWSLQFWVTIADPVHVFFACPASGHCSWDPPVGAFVVPRSADGEWWELADATRGNRSYYYNTLTGKTQWTRPDGDAFVIPLGLIQRNALPERSAQPAATNGEGATGAAPSNGYDREPSAPVTPRRGPPFVSVAPGPPPTPSTPGSVASPTRLNSSASRSGTSRTSTQPTTPARREPVTPTRSKSSPRSPPGSAAAVRFSSLDLNATRLGKSESDIAHPDGAHGTSGVGVNGLGPLVEADEDRGWWDRRKSAVRAMASPRAKLRKDSKDARPIDVPTLESLAEAASPSVPPSPAAEMSVQTKRLSTGLHPLMRPDISGEIQAFRADDFAGRYFATKRAGVLRQRVPVAKILEWQRQPISAPLLVLSRQSAKDAVASFKVIQHVMGERERPVEGARMGGPGRAHGQGHQSAPSPKTVVLEEVRWMVQLGVLRGEMRDEIYCQLIKQLTKNPDNDANVLGFQLFCVLVAAFVPSKNFEQFVKAFLRREYKDGLAIMAKYCLDKLETMIRKGGRGLVLTLAEIEHASDAAFYPSVFGQRLERVMQLQEPSYPDLQIPIILPFLADGILALGGMESEGIFRVPGDHDAVGDLKARIDRGHYQLSGIDDPHVAASLFKAWLRDLEDPLVPGDMYATALAASREPAACVALVAALPDHQRRVLLFVVSFLQLFLEPRVVETTKMSAANIALVLAPNILRSTSGDFETAFSDTHFASRFLLHLLNHLDPRALDAGYAPVHGPAVPRDAQ